MKKANKILSLLMAMVMVFGLCNLGAVTAYAEGEPAFIQQPQGGTVNPDENLSVSWEVNFEQKRICIYNNGETVCDITDETVASLKSYELGAGGPYVVRAYYDLEEGKYIDSESFMVSEVENCIVTFDSKGGSAVEAQSVIKGQTASKPADPVKAGNHFVGWCSDEACKIEYIFASVVNEDITLHAKWLPVVSGVSVKASEPEKVEDENYKLKIDSVEAVFSGSDIAEVKYDGVSILYSDAECMNPLTDAPLPEDECYFWLNMSAGEAGNPKVFWGEGIKDGSTSKAEGGALTIVDVIHSPDGTQMSILYKYQKDVPAPVRLAVKLSWDDNFDSMRLRPHAVIVKLMANSEDTGKRLSLNESEGWSGSIPNLPVWKDGKEIKYTWEQELPKSYQLSSSSEKDLVTELNNKLITYTVTFHVNGGSSVDKRVVGADQKVGKPSDPNRLGYIFSGWYQEESFTNAFNFDAPIVKDVEVFAKWTPITYTVSKGADSVWGRNDSNTISITVKRSIDDIICFDHFKELLIDDKPVDAKGYEAKSGSTIITIKIATLQNLVNGKHTVTIRFDDGEAQTYLTIKNGSGSPKTGDANNMGLWMALVVMSSVGLGAVAVVSKKRKVFDR